MTRSMFAGIPLVLCWALAHATPAEGSGAIASEECAIGVMVKAIQRALEAPQQEGALETIIGYGTDSRYYVMIRGWLVQELAGVQSRLDAARDEATRSAAELKAEFLTRAIRGIDLE